MRITTSGNGNVQSHDQEENKQTQPKLVTNV